MEVCDYCAINDPDYTFDDAIEYAKNGNDCVVCERCLIDEINISDPRFAGWFKPFYSYGKNWCRVVRIVGEQEGD